MLTRVLQGRSSFSRARSCHTIRSHENSCYPHLHQDGPGNNSVVNLAHPLHATQSLAAALELFIIQSFTHGKTDMTAVSHISDTHHPDLVQCSALDVDEARPSLLRG
ncbi:hypothetical protein C8Q79DRAFT_471626 [Trametes meyenii]|nr:hypothetical protein C8Q79DRAFT_471626 [Trametes meyenii]